jgi:hypothetical protein
MKQPLVISAENSRWLQDKLERALGKIPEPYTITHLHSHIAFNYADEANFQLHTVILIIERPDPNASPFFESIGEEEDD